MTRVLVWKELREQGLVLVSLLALGSGLLVAVAVLATTGEAGRATDLRSLTTIGALGLIALTMTAGVVVGGTLFAGEREAGTFTFLDSLPAARWRVWLGKAVAGAVLVGASTAVFLTVAALAGLVDAERRLVGWALLALVIGYAAYGWGMLGSVIARSSLGACGLGLLFGTFATGFLYAFTGVGLAVLRKQLEADQYEGFRSEYRVWEWAGLTTVWGLLAFPMPIAFWLYTAPDRSRRMAAADVRLPGVRGAVGRGLAAVSPGGWAAGIRRLVWLTYRQYRVPALILGGVAAVLGGATIPPDAQPILLWPGVTLFLGVIVGVIGMSDEQNSGAYRFWGERRLPAGRAWLGKVAGGFGLTLALLVVMLAVMLAGLAATGGGRGTLVASLFRTGLLEPIDGFPVVTFLLLWPVYGFTFGHLAAVLFRKGVVAGAVGVMTGGTLAALWMPSLLSGGLHGWQVWAPPAVALVTARVLMWPWATDRVGARGPLVRLAAGVAGVLAVTAAGIGYRVAEVPAVAEAGADRAFAQTLPTFDEKQAGRDLRRAAGLLAEVPRDLRTEQADRPIAPRRGWDRLPPDNLERTIWYQAAEVPRTGWPADRPDLDRWLDEVFANGWDRLIVDAAKKPTGVLEDPNELTVASPLRHLDGVRPMAHLFLARGLQEQVRGNPEKFVGTPAEPGYLDAWLAAVRTTRNKSTQIMVYVSRGMEAPAYHALDRWLERLAGRPDLLRRALAVLLAHDAADPFDPAAARLAQQVVVRNSIDAPSGWLGRYLDDIRPAGPDGRGYRQEVSPQADVEAGLAAFAWVVPWEKERLRRVVDLGNAPGRERESRKLLAGLPGGQFLSGEWLRSDAELEDGHKVILAARRAAILKVALRLHQAETGRLPATLAELVPAYLPKLPTDPYGSQPFRYRVSRGESIEREVSPTPSEGPVGPPGVDGTPLTVDQFRATAGAVGGAVAWPLEEGWDVPPSVPEPGADPDAPLGPMFPPVAVGAGTTATTESVPVPAGQGILWSVGPDGVDHGGVRAVEARRPSDAQPDGDLIYTVPLPPEAKK